MTEFEHIHGVVPYENYSFFDRFMHSEGIMHGMFHGDMWSHNAKYEIPHVGTMQIRWERDFAKQEEHLDNRVEIVYPKRAWRALEDFRVFMEDHMFYKDVKMADGEFPIPQFSYHSMEESALAWLDANVQRVPWTGKKAEDKFARRSIAEILDEHEVCFMNPCVPLSQVLAWVIHNQDYTRDTQMLIEELDFGPESDPRYKLHGAVQYRLLGESRLRSLDILRANKAYLREGPYELIGERRAHDRISLLRLPAERLVAETPLYQVLGSKSLEDLGHLFKEYKFGPNIKKLASSCRKDKREKGSIWKQYQMGNGDQPLVIIDVNGLLRPKDFRKVA